MIDGFPPSVNHLYIHRGFRKIKTKKYNDWEANVFKSLEDTKRPEVRGLLRVEIDYCSDHWFTKKDGKPRRVDLDNLQKATLDPLFKWLDVDDKLVFELMTRKRLLSRGEDRYIVVRVFEVAEGFSASDQLCV